MKVEFPSSSTYRSLHACIYSGKKFPLSEFQRIQHRLISHRMQLKQPLTRDFSRLRSLLRCRVDGPPMNAIRSRRSSKNVAHSHANDTRPRRINERHRCRASSRRSLIGRRGINRAAQCTRCPPISNPSPLEKKIR